MFCRVFCAKRLDIYGSNRYWQNWDKGNIARAVEERWETSPIEVQWRKTLVADIEAQIDKGATILEIGCGSGQVYGAMSRQGFATPESYIGGDISKKMLEIAKSRYPKTQFVTLDILNLPYQDKAQPTVICIQVLQHLPYYTDALKELMRITGKQLYITSWFNTGTEDTITFGKTEWGASFYNNHYALDKFVNFIRSIANGRIETISTKCLGEPSYSVVVTFKSR